MSRTTEMLLLQADTDHVNLVRARRSGGRVELLHPLSLRIRDKGKDAQSLDDPNVRASLAKHVAERGWRGRELTCLLGGPSVACYYYDLPRLKEQDLRQAVHLKLKQQLHFDVSEAIVAVDVLDPVSTPKADLIRVRGTAIHRGRITSLVDAASGAGLNVAAVSATPAALAALAQDYLKTERGATAALYVDETASTLVVLNDGTPFLTTELSIGLNSLTAGLMRPIIDGERVIQLDESKAVELRNAIGIPVAGQMIESLAVDGQRLLPLIEPALQKFAKHLLQWLTFAATTTAGAKITTVKLVGPGAAVPNLDQALGTRISREVHVGRWICDATLAGQPDQPVLLEACAPTIAAIKHWRNLPDMLPPEMHLRRRLGRVRRSVVSCGLIAAAAVLAFAVLFDRIHAHLLPSVELQRRHLPGVQEVVNQNQKWLEEKSAVRRMQAEFDQFTASSPTWVGLFKELAARLPLEVRATEISARGTDDGIKLSLSGDVLLRQGGGTFDEAVEKTLLRLQHSPFFRRVQLLGASRGSDQNRDAAGTLSVEMDLIYPLESSRT